MNFGFHFSDSVKGSGLWRTGKIPDLQEYGTNKESLFLWYAEYSSAPV